VGASKKAKATSTKPIHPSSQIILGINFIFFHTKENVSSYIHGYGYILFPFKKNED
jgi:hypothetical protein